MSTQTILIGARPMFREGLALILAQAGFEVVVATASTASALQAPPVPLIVLDAVGKPSGIVEEIATLHRGMPEARIALVVGHDKLDRPHVMECFRAGMHAYLINPSTEVFIKSLELIMLGQTILPKEVFAEMPHRTEVVPGDVLLLSAREKEVLRHVSDGLSNKRIARLINTAEATVKVHLKSILRKLNVRNRTQAAMWAVANLPAANGRNVLQTVVDAIRVPEGM